MRTRNIVMTLALVLVLASATAGFARSGSYGGHDRNSSGQRSEQMHRNGGSNYGYGNHMTGQRMNNRMNEQHMSTMDRSGYGHRMNNSQRMGGMNGTGHRGGRY